MKVLVGCEESQAVCIAFRERGHEAYSCDLQECSGGHPEWHYQEDIFEVIDKGWDMMIAFPPCTHLAVSGAKHFEKKRQDGRQMEGINFFLQLANCGIDKICLENPIGIMSKFYRQPDQIIQPYFFGDPFQKTTCLWFKNLPKLFHANKPDLFNDKVTHTHKGQVTNAGGYTMSQWYRDTSKYSSTNGDRAKARSKTFPGIAAAMAAQWG